MTVRHEFAMLCETVAYWYVLWILTNIRQMYIDSKYNILLDLIFCALKTSVVNNIWFICYLVSKSHEKQVLDSPGTNLFTLEYLQYNKLYISKYTAFYLFLLHFSYLQASNLPYHRSLQIQVLDTHSPQRIAILPT